MKPLWTETFVRQSIGDALRRTTKRAKLARTAHDSLKDQGTAYARAIDLVASTYEKAVEVYAGALAELGEDSKP